MLFLDEPTVAVDPQSRNRILEGIKQLRDDGTTVVYTTHYMEEVEYLCDRLAILDHGKILVTGTTEEILSRSSISESMEIVAYDLPDFILNQLQNNSAVDSLSYRDGKLNIALRQGDNMLIPVLELLADSDIEPVSISRRKPTLNDVFLEITGKELRDNA